jgi:hypothetical protein
MECFNLLRFYFKFNKVGGKKNSLQNLETQLQNNKTPAWLS